MDSFIATSINMLPELAQEILAQGKVGNSIGAREKQEQLSKAVIAISRHGKIDNEMLREDRRLRRGFKYEITGSWVETMKVAMSLLTNVNAGPVRAPLKDLSPEITATMASGLRSLGLQVTV